MKRHIILDSTPLGLLSSPARSAVVLEIHAWMTACLAAQHKIYVAEVIDYEVRRELIRAEKRAGIANLDSLKTSLRYLPITTEAMLLAANLWADSRKSGIPTGDPKKLDIDVILAGQALTLDTDTSKVIVATSNVAHISRFVAAEEWGNIAP